MTARGLVAASEPQAVEAGLNLLRGGGNAIDAALAVNAVLGLTEPTGGGLGGDLFALFWSARERRLVGYDGSGRSPQNLTREALLEHGDLIPPQGPAAVSVPGCVEGWGRLHERYGCRPLADCLAPAIELARTGALIAPVIADQWSRGARHHRDQPGFGEVFLPEGTPPQAGNRHRNQALADTLDRIARDGWHEFYQGESARHLVEFCARHGCALDAGDLANHRGTWTEPVSTTYRGLEVWQLPPQGQGIAVLQLLNLLEALEHHTFDPDGVESAHLFIEAKRLVFEDRARWYADPAFAHIPVEHLISKDYARSRAALINPRRTAPHVTAGDPQLQKGGTVTLATADDEGNLVCWIQSNYMGFGSGLAVPALGFGLQNRGCLFNLRQPDHPNAYAPGKRPFHTIIPGFVTRDKKPWMALGVMGGDYQPVGQARILQLLHDHGREPQAASDAPRLHHVGSSEPTGTPADNPGTVFVEAGISHKLRRGLEARGHVISETESLRFGGAQAVWRTDGGGWDGLSESRKDGFVGRLD